MRSRVLLIDDEEPLCAAVEKILHREGHDVISRHSGREGLAGIAGADLLITDLRLPDLDGIEILARAREQRPDIEVIVLTAHGSVDKAVEAMRGGAYDFIEKPIERDVLVRTVARALDRRRLTAENRRLRERLDRRDGVQKLIGESPAMVALRELVAQIAATDVRVLVQGESGTGKEIIADLIHRLSGRRDQPIVKINCAAIPETLLEAELFGYERGAFTGALAARPGRFELANGGTLFLDEVAEMSPRLQAKLLRVLQDGSYQRLGSDSGRRTDMRVVSATHADLWKEMQDGRFRDDLYYRLNVTQIVVPPLRNRREDIPSLAATLLAKFAARMGREAPEIAPPAMDQLLRHDWPGNVRELENALQCGLALCLGSTIDSFRLGEDRRVQPTSRHNAITLPIGSSLAQAEEKLIRATLDHCGGNKEQTARILGISARTLYRYFARDRAGASDETSYVSSEN